MSDLPMNMQCPNCKKPVSSDRARSPWRPFCSERCKLIDLGDWVSERHAIAGEPADPHQLQSGPTAPHDVADPNLIDIDFLHRH